MLFLGTALLPTVIVVNALITVLPGLLLASNEIKLTWVIIKSKI